MDEETRSQLIEVASAARANAHCPYSQFAVGAAVLTDTGDVYGGANVENISYGLTNCAERVAIQGAVARGAKRIVAMVVVAETEPPTPPCGACRQVLFEFGRDAAVILVGRETTIETTTEGLLPGAFEEMN